ncbi:MAG: NfeD family protein [Bacteroidales bacterium]
MAALIITLIIVGLILLIAELLIIPGFGIAGILGVISMVASCWFAFDSYGHIIGLIVIAINIIVIIISTIFILRSKTWKAISLKTNIDSKVDTSPHTKGITEGMSGKTLTRLAPGGHAKLGENVIEVFTRDSLVEPGKEVEVCEIDGNKIFVKEIKK